MCAEREMQLARARRAHRGTAHALRAHAQTPNSKGGQTADSANALCRRLTAVRYKGWCWGPTDPIRYTHDRRIQPAENRNNPTSKQPPAALLCHMR